MKIYIITTVARQQDGEYVFVNVEKVFKDKGKATEYISDKKLNEAVTIQGIQCLAERGLLEAELE